MVRWPNRAMGEREQGLRVSVSDERGRPLRATGLALWLRRVAPRRARGAVSIALVSDRRIRSLNRTYRRRDYATDVLSFPSKERDFLGDIAIAKGVAARQARDRQHSFATELRVLALHGLLHLIGYDHERDRTRTSGLHGYRVGISPNGARALKACLDPELFATFVATTGAPYDTLAMLTERYRTLIRISGR